MEQNGMISIDFCLMVQNGWWFRMVDDFDSILFWEEFLIHDFVMVMAYKARFVGVRIMLDPAHKSENQPQIEPFFDLIWFHMHHTSHMNWDRCVPHLLPITSVERPQSSKLLQIIWTKRETAAQRLNRAILPPCLMLPMHITWRFQLPKAEIDVCCLFNLQTMDIEGRMCKQYLQCLQLRETSWNQIFLILKKEWLKAAAPPASACWILPRLGQWECSGESPPQNVLDNLGPVLSGETIHNDASLPLSLPCSTTNTKHCHELSWIVHLNRFKLLFHGWNFMEKTWKNLISSVPRFQAVESAEPLRSGALCALSSWTQSLGHFPRTTCIWLLGFLWNTGNGRNHGINHHKPW